jgi:hypothetical protein
MTALACCQPQRRALTAPGGRPPVHWDGARTRPSSQHARRPYSGQHYSSLGVMGDRLPLGVGV